MNSTSAKFHFPSEIKLERNPLVEAWLDIRWELEPSELSDLPRSRIDPGFPFALGVFYEGIKDQFGVREPLPATNVPVEMLPYVVRYRFRVSPDGWPLLQLGPGVATVNFTRPYTWEDLKEKALYLREKLLHAYGETKLQLQSLSLRYRNAVPFDHETNDLLAFLSRNLYISVTTPPHVPGKIASTDSPSEVNLVLVYDLLDPVGKGSLRFVTGEETSQDSESDQSATKPVLVFELAVQSQGDDVPELAAKDAFEQWLTSAHAVIHEWFFALIEGPLRHKYESE